MYEIIEKLIDDCREFKRNNDEMIDKCEKAIEEATAESEAAAVDMDNAALNDDAKQWEKSKGRKENAKKKLAFYNARKKALAGSGTISREEYAEKWRIIEKELAEMIMRQREFIIKLRAMYDEEMQKENAFQAAALDALSALNKIADSKAYNITTKDYASRITLETYLNSVMVPIVEMDPNKTHLPQLKKAVNILGADPQKYSAAVLNELTKGTNENKTEQAKTNTENAVPFITYADLP